MKAYVQDQNYKNFVSEKNSIFEFDIFLLFQNYSRSNRKHFRQHKIQTW